MEKTEVERLYREFSEVVAFLDVSKEPSLYSIVNDNFRKVLLIAAALYFERRVCDDILEFAKRVSSANPLLAAFVKNKAIDRQYHTLFTWGGNNANQFFALFGEDYKKHMETQIRESEELEKAVKAFLEFGAQRNILVHQNYATFPLDKTAQEIYKAYELALVFVDAIPESLEDRSP